MRKDFLFTLEGLTLPVQLGGRSLLDIRIWYGIVKYAQFDAGRCLIGSLEHS